MLEFRPVTLKDKIWMEPILKKENSRNSDGNFGSIYVWDKHYKTLAARFEDRLVLKVCYSDKSLYSYPVGSGDLKGAIDELLTIENSKGEKLNLIRVEEKGREEIEKLYPGMFEFTVDDSICDYMYLADKLATYSGKAYHGQKNHCNKFEKTYSWRFEKLTRELIPECMNLLQSWSETNRDRLDRSISIEHDVAVKSFASFEALDLLGGVLFADDCLVGFSLGEMANDDTFDVRIEKAETEIAGAYQMVCREFAKLVLKEHPEVVYLNREEDLGLERLRQAKLNLKPDYILKKYTAVQK